jgi:hypothetical protein
LLVNRDDGIRCQGEEVGAAVAASEALISVANTKDLPYPVAVPELHDQGSDDIVETGRKSPTGRHGHSGSRGIEVDSGSGSGHLEAGGLIAGGIRAPNRSNVGVGENPHTVVDEAAARRAG